METEEERKRGKENCEGTGKIRKGNESAKGEGNRQEGKMREG